MIVGSDLKLDPTLAHFLNYWLLLRLVVIYGCSNNVVTDLKMLGCFDLVSYWPWLSFPYALLLLCCPEFVLYWSFCIYI